MSLTADAWYSLLTFRKRPIGLVVVAHSREWGRVELIELEGLHPAALQFVRSLAGSLRKRIQRQDVPKRVDLEHLARKLSGEVRLSSPLPVDGPNPEEIQQHLMKSCLPGGAK